MTTPQLDALSVANNISANTSKAQYNKTKNQLQKSEIGIKKAQLLGSLPSSTDVAGDVMMGGANSMAQSPRNGMTGLVEGLLRAFGGSLKGKAADERRQQIMDSLDVLDYTMQGEEYLKNTQQQIAKQQEDMQYRPSQKQYEQSYSDGTLEPTLKATFQQMGVDPNNVQLSSDGLNVFVEKDGQVTKAPVSDFFSPEDSQKFQFINSTQKANLAKSENKQIQGLAQENNTLKSRLQTLEEQFSQMEGISPVMAKSLARGVVEGERVQQKEESYKEKGLSLQERGLGIQQQNANISQDYLDLEKGKATGENGTSEADKLFLQESTKAAAKDAAEYRKNIRQDYEESQKLEQVSKDIKEALKAGAFTNEGSASRVRAFLGLAAGGKGATATQMLQQAAGNLIPKIKDAFGGRVTNTDLEFAEEFMLPGSKISKASNEKFLQGLDRLIQKKKSQYTNLENIADENGGMLPRDYLSRLRKIEESNNVQQSNMGQQEDKVLVKTPQGVGYISREQYNALKQ